MLLCVFVFYSAAAFAEEPKIIPLETAIAKALQASPRMESASASIKASQGDEHQSDAWQNPQLVLQAENFTGSGPYTGYSSGETTAGISQLVELGGKRSKRKAVAAQGVAISQYDQEVEKLDLVSETRVAYANAVAAQERLKLATEKKNVADRLYKEVNQRVSAAREPLIQKSKAQITVSAAKFEKDKATRELDHAKHVLASLWNGHDSNYTLQTDYFFKAKPPMSEQTAEEKLEKSAYLKRMDAAQSQMQAVHKLEQVQAVPDPTIGLNIRDFRNTGDQAFVATVSFPLPVLNVNGGGIERARQNIVKAASDKQSVRLSLVNDLHEALESMTNSYENANNLKKSILPSAEKSFALSRQGYNAGKFAYLEVLDSQRTLFQVKEQYIDTLKDYHTAKAVVDRLTGETTAKNEAQNEK